jgi:hypothetical protein
MPPRPSWWHDAFRDQHEPHRQPVDKPPALAAERYTLTAEKVEATRVRLNGEDLELGIDDELPRLQGQRIESGQVEFAPVARPSTFRRLVIAIKVMMFFNC